MLQKKYISLAIVSGAIVLADQMTKALILKYLPLHHSFPVIEGFFDLTHILNPGGAFGLMADMSVVVRTVVFLFISSLAVGLILYFYIKTPPRVCLAGGRLCLDFRRGHRQFDRQGSIRNGGGFP